MGATKNRSVVEIQQDSEQSGAKKRLKELGIKLPTPPELFGTYAEAVQGSKLFRSLSADAIHRRTQ